MQETVAIQRDTTVKYYPYLECGPCAEQQNQPYILEHDEINSVDLIGWSLSITDIRKLIYWEYNIYYNQRETACTCAKLPVPARNLIFCHLKH